MLFSHFYSNEDYGASIDKINICAHFKFIEVFKISIEVELKNRVSQCTSNIHTCTHECIYYNYSNHL